MSGFWFCSSTTIDIFGIYWSFMLSSRRKCIFKLIQEMKRLLGRPWPTQDTCKCASLLSG